MPLRQTYAIRCRKLCRAVKIAHFIQKYGILNKKISELLRKALRGKKLVEPFLLGQGPVYQYGVFRVPKNGILVNK